MTSNDIHTNLDLLQRVAKGDEQAFTNLFYQWEPFLFTHIYRITESKTIAEEIVQDVFLKIWQTRETLAEIRNFKAYLLSISKNHAINVLKRMAREFRNWENWVKDNVITSDDEDSTQLYFSLIDEAVDNLTERQRQVYIMHRQQRKTYQEIAKELGIGRESVKTHLQLALKHITTYVNGKIAAAIILFIFQG